MDSVISKVNAFVEGYGKDNGYTFIFGKNQAGSVMYGAEAKDITVEITKAINAAFGKKDADPKKEETEKNNSEAEESKE
jgi:outer membrane protein